MTMTDLRQRGYERTETECPICEEGELFVNSFELVCERCNGVIRKGNSMNGDDPVEYFRKERDEFTYDNSGEVICPGGFSRAYRGPGLYGNGEEQESGS